MNGKGTEESGAVNINPSSNRGLTPLHMAARGGRMSVYKLLMGQAVDKTEEGDTDCSPAGLPNDTILFFLLAYLVVIKSEVKLTQT